MYQVFGLLVLVAAGWALLMLLALHAAHNSKATAMTYARTLWYSIVASPLHVLMLPVLALQIAGLILIATETDARSLWIMLLSVMLALIGYSFRLMIRPSVLFLSRSSTNALAIARHLRKACKPHRVVWMLDRYYVEDQDARENPFESSNFRTDGRWTPMFEMFAGICDHIVVDARLDSRAVAYELGRIIDRGLLDKCIFILDRHGTYPPVLTHLEPESTLNINGAIGAGAEDKLLTLLGLKRGSS
jgi:hypothetical protein